MGQTMEWQNVRLSPNFSLHELCASHDHPQLVEPPSPVVTFWLTWWARAALEPARHVLGPLLISSGFRNPLLNEAVGGEKRSIHQVMMEGRFVGCASDIRPKRMALDEAFRRIARLSPNVPIRGVIIYPSRGFIHIDSRDGKSRRFFMSLKKGSYVEISPVQARNWRVPSDAFTTR